VAKVAIYRKRANAVQNSPFAASVSYNFWSLAYVVVLVVGIGGVHGVTIRLPL